MPVIGAKRVRALPYKAKRKRTKYASPSAMIMSVKPTIRRLFPQQSRHRTTLRYFGNFLALNPGAGGIAASHVFSCNGLFDPDITGGGHQPIGFDELMALYDHYTVLGAKIRCYFKNAATTNSAFIAVCVRDTTTASTDTREIVENGYVAMKMIDAADGNGNSIGEVATSVDVAKFLGRFNALADPDLKGSISANPVEGCFFHVTAFPPNSVDMGTLYANVVIDYDVIFHERKITLPS